MSKRRTRSRQAPATSAAPCPCGLPAPLQDCCGRLHRGEVQARTAEQLMRSRFSAFAVEDRDYLLRTWHPAARPGRLDFEPGMRWRRLEILATAEGSPFHTEGTVEFRAHYTQGGRPGELHEVSRFVRHEGAWVYHGGHGARKPSGPVGPVI
ncbi:YchJ family protein [Actinomadura viridis]|uniref:YchJ family protein n=1 Tax=Actinomadura viridis TaxID=58110 RepID=UPI003675E212